MEWTEGIDAGSPIALVLRHSHREVIKDYQEMLSGGLTEIGLSMSQEMGRRLPPGRTVSVYSSFVPRCYDTALAISEGITQMGGTVESVQTLDSLFSPDYTQEEVWSHLQPDGRNVTEFVNRWADGELGDGIEPYENFARRLVDDTVTRLLAASEGVLHIHVTHDLSLMSLKRALYFRALTPEDREPYLGGLGMYFKDDRVTVFAGATRQTVSMIPPRDLQTDAR